ncbi:MAG: NAD(+)--dinitrogen-reductase ADP-D-ribosyltransferase [Thermodesulfobacteriota bacterium]
MNLCNLPPWAIAAPEFNENPQRIEIQGVRRFHRQLFERLCSLADPADRAQAFQDHMDVAFQLHQWSRETSPLGRKSLKNSYLRFLRGWMFDANSVEGAVLKGWVESRIGIPPTFHKGPIGDADSEGYGAYLVDRMRGTARTSAIQAQFDLLYEYVQEELRLRGEPAAFALFRGVHDLQEHKVLAELGRNRKRLRLNNLNSFTDDFERAFQFGTRVLEVRVPFCKVFFRADLLPGAVLKGEEEVLVIGGDFDVVVRTG